MRPAAQEFENRPLGPTNLLLPASPSLLNRHAALSHLRLSLLELSLNKRSSS